MKRNVSGSVSGSLKYVYKFFTSFTNKICFENVDKQARSSNLYKKGETRFD